MDPILQSGIALAREGKFQEALEEFKKHLVQHSDDAEAFFLAGSCFFKMGD